MATYVVGDIQGCYSALQRLLSKLQFNPGADHLVLAGDLVNRGEDSLATLRLLHGMREHVSGVLGNHDLHLLALAHGVREPQANEEDLAAILAAPDSTALLSWLQSFPLAHYFTVHDTLLTHAGWPPQWSLAELLQYSAEVGEVLQSSQAGLYFSHMYGNEPNSWSPQLEGPERWRVITNYLTRMRLLKQTDNSLNLTAKASPKDAPLGYLPWFQQRSHQRGNTRILFGHWAALKGQAHTPNVEALDSGCVWGGYLTAYCLETQQRTQVSCSTQA